MDLHDRFADWLTAGAEGEPPRDLALHASGCDACLRSVAALDSLLAIDIGDAPLPPLRTVAEDTNRIPQMLRFAAGVIAVVLLGTSVAIGATGLLRPAEAGPEPNLQSPREDELAGEPTTPTPELATVAPIESETVSPTPTPSASETVVADATAAPIQAPAPRTPTPQPPGAAAPQPPGTPQPTAPPSTPTAAPTATSTPIVTESASPTISVAPTSPSPTLAIGDCADGLDNDGDGFIDDADSDCSIGDFEVTPPLP